MPAPMRKDLSLTHPETIEIAARYNGPPGSANGGYAAGVFAALVDGPAEVNLRAPPPLDKPIRVVSGAQGFEFFDGDTLVATSAPSGFLPPTPDAPTPDQALNGRSHFPPEEDHAFPSCFVCGPHRKVGDGLRLFTGPADGFDGVADVWVPAPEFAGGDSLVRPEILWAALDCPGAFAVGFGGNPMVLARIVGNLHALPKAAETRWWWPAGPSSMTGANTAPARPSTQKTAS
ncbi:MAG: hypothetical protein ACPH9E_00210 [Hyphomonas sp.]